MKYILVVLSALCLASISELSVLGSVPQGQSNLMQIEDVHAGMKGYGMTVFQGTKPERFEVEVLGILNGVPNPKQCSVIARLSGPLVDRTGVFAGMSGSPVYIDGKLVGAVAFTFPFSKEPIAGITPIKYMIDNFDRGNDQQPPSGKNISFNTLIAMAEEASRPASGGAGLAFPNGFAAASSAGAAMVPIGQQLDPSARGRACDRQPRTLELVNNNKNPGSLLRVCAVQRRRSAVGYKCRQALQPEATEAAMEVTKWLKPSVSASRYAVMEG